MASTPIGFPVPAWIKQDIVVYHGTVDSFAPVVEKGVIQVSLGRTHTDFGPGFYTTTLLRQAHTWAAEIAASKAGTKPAVIEITILREDLVIGALSTTVARALLITDARCPRRITNLYTVPLPRFGTSG